MPFFEENISLSEGRIDNEINIGLAPLNGAGIFFNRDTKKSSHWSIPWSDLMMTMFILFCVLYTYKTPNIKEVQIPKIETKIEVHEQERFYPSEELYRFYEMSRKTLNAEELQDITSVELTDDKTVKIILPSDILFDTGEAALKSGALGSLKAVGGLIKDTKYAVTIAGHTDNIPIHTERFPSNWELSTSRACVAAKYLIDETNIPPDQIQVIGYAEYRPIESNDTPEGRHANRRVEVIISKEHISDNLSRL